jgi:tetratricopeptide (TPR) repeat protein
MEKLDADPREARTKIGLIYLEKGDPERAATEFNLVLAAEPENWRVHYYLGSVYAERKENDRALAEFARIPPDSEYYVDSRIQRAYVLQKSDRVPEAIREVEGALKVKPDNPDLMGYLAALYREQKELKSAIALLERMVERYPDNDRYRFTLGAAYDEAKDKNRTIEQMRRAVELNPKNAAALNYLGYTYAEMGVRLDEAEQLIRRALEIEPDDGFYVDSLGWVFYQRGDYRHAVEQLEHAVELAGEDPTVAEHLGDAYDRNGRPREALRVYRDALARAKDTGQIDRLKEKIRALDRTEGAAGL